MFFLLQQKKQLKFVIVLIVFILINAAILYFYFREPKIAAIGETSAGKNNFGIIKRIQIDKNFFKSPQYQAAKFYGSWPLEIGKIGRENPFIPY